MVSDSSIMSVREMIDTCFGEPNVNVVNFKLMQAILYLLARQQRLLERRVAIELGVSLVPKTSSLSITEVKLKANVVKKKKKFSGPVKSEFASPKSKGEKHKTSSQPTADETSTSKSITETTTTDKTSSKSTTDKTSSKSTTDKTTASKLTTDKTATFKSTTDETTTSKSTTDKTTTSKSTTDKTTTSKSTSDKTTTSKSTSDKTTTSKLSSDKTKSKGEKTGPTTTDKTLSKATTDKTGTSEKKQYSSDKTKPSPGITSSTQSSDKSRTGKTKKTDYHLLELIEQQREQELRVVNQRADSREVAEKTPTPMASLDSMEVQYEKLLVVERVPVEGAEKKIGRLHEKFSKLDVVTQNEFDELARLVKTMQISLGIDADFPEQMRDLRRGSSVTDAMAALQLAKRIECLEKTMNLMESIITNLAVKKGINFSQIDEVKVQTYMVLQTQMGDETPETKVIYDAPRGQNISGGEADVNIPLSEQPTMGTDDPIEEMLKGVPELSTSNNITGADLDNAMQKLYEEFKKTVGSLNNQAITKADDALKTATRLETKLDKALEVDTRMLDLEKLISEYTGKINVLDTGLTSQMSNYQEQLTQMQHDLEGGLEAMAEALANPPGETPGFAELTANFSNLQIQFDISNMRQKDLQESQLVLSVDIEALWKDIELLREIKSDRDEVTDALRDKAGLGELNGLVTQQQFDAVRGDFEKKIGASYEKFNNQEIVWQKVIDDLVRELNEKANWVQVTTLRDEINNNLERLQNKIRAIEEIIGEPRAATTSRRLFRDAACLCCSTPALMNLEEPTVLALPAFTNLSTRPATIGAEDATKPKEDGDHGLCYPGKPIPHARDPRSHVCRRWCGGSHTAIRGTLSRAPAEMCVSTLRPETTGLGSDGKLYVMDEQEKEKKPCGPCNIPQTVTPPVSEIEKDFRFEMDSETEKSYVWPIERAADSAVSVTPPPPLDDD